MLGSLFDGNNGLNGQKLDKIRNLSSYFTQTAHIKGILLTYFGKCFKPAIYQAQCSNRF